MVALAVFARADIHPKIGSVGAAVAVIGAALRRAGVQPREEVEHAGPVVRVDEVAARFAHQLFRAPAENAFDGGRDVAAGAVEIAEDDDVAGVLGEQAEAGLAFAERGLGGASFGDVGMGGDPAAVFHRADAARDETAVGELHDVVGRGAVDQDGVAPFHIVPRGGDGGGAGGDAQGDDLREGHAGADGVGVEAVFCGEARVGDDEALVTVEQAEALCHVVHDGVELLAEALGGGSSEAPGKVPECANPGLDGHGEISRSVRSRDH